MISNRYSAILSPLCILPMRMHKVAMSRGFDLSGLGFCERATALRFGCVLTPAVAMLCGPVQCCVRCSSGFCFCVTFLLIILFPNLLGDLSTYRIFVLISQGPTHQNRPCPNAFLVQILFVRRVFCKHNSYTFCHAALAQRYSNDGGRLGQCLHRAERADRHSAAAK